MEETNEQKLDLVEQHHEKKKDLRKLKKAIKSMPCSVRPCVLKVVEEADGEADEVESNDANKQMSKNHDQDGYDLIKNEVLSIL